MPGGTFSLKESDNIQGDILAPFKKRHFAFLLIKYQFDPANNKPGRDWIGQMVKEFISTTWDVVKAVRDNDTDGRLWTNLSFTAGGLIVVDKRFEQRLGELEAFREGGSSDRTLNKLNDRRGDLQSNSLLGDKGSEVMGVIKIAADDQKLLNNHIRALSQLAGSFGITLDDSVRSEGQTRPDPITGEEKAIESGFGFRDGISQPRIMGYHDDGILQPGEFILGYDSESGLSTSPDWMKDGSFMVLRKLEQNLDVWKPQLSHIVDECKNRLKLEINTDKAAAMLIGRTKDGELLTGHELERFAHVSKMTTENTGLSNRHRIIRRGVSYSEGGKVGLLFNAYMANIEEQFEYLQTVWANDKNAPPFQGADPVIGNVHEPFEVAVNQGRGCRMGLSKAVVTRGSLYTFVPSLTLLREIAR